MALIKSKVGNTTYSWKSDDIRDGEINNIAKTMAYNSAHNLIPFNLDSMKAINTNGTWNGNVFTRNNLSFTVNDDYSIDVVGSTNETIFYNYAFMAGTIGMNYILSGCPSGGSHTTYKLVWNYYGSDLGNGAVCVGTGQNEPINLEIYPGQTCNFTFYPMVRLASDLCSEYTRPSILTNKELTEKVTIYKKIMNINTNNQNRVGQTGLYESQCIILSVLAPGFNARISTVYNDEYYCEIDEYITGEPSHVDSIQVTIYYIKK